MTVAPSTPQLPPSPRPGPTADADTTGTAAPANIEELLATTRSWPWALIVTIAVAVWVPLKLLRVARQDVTITLAIAQSSDKTAMIPGLIILGLTIVLPTVFVFVANSTLRMIGTALRTLSASATTPRDRASGRVGLKRPAIGSAVSAALLALMVVAQPVWVPIFAVCALAIMRLIDVTTRDTQRLERFLTRRLQPHPRRAAITFFATVFVGVFVLAWPVAQLPLNDQVWLPTYQVETEPSLNGPAASYVGYVLDESDDELVLLTDKDRKIITIAADDIASQVLCRLDGSYETRSLLDLAAGKQRTRTPPCESSTPDDTRPAP